MIFRFGRLFDELLSQIYVMKKLAFLIVALSVVSVTVCVSQSFDLQKLLKSQKLISDKLVTPFADGKRKAVSTRGIAWLDGVNFSTGTIEVDLRGRDVSQQSFLGIAFHGVDTITYEAIYFRPFNFQSTDSVKKIHAVQYISHPEYTWKRLRAERNGVYEKGISPPPSPISWLHARIVVEATTIAVYVNGETIPSLQVNRLAGRKDGLIGLWNFTAGLAGDFANLTITK